MRNHSQRASEIARVEARPRNIWRKGRTELGRDFARMGKERQSSLKRSSTGFGTSGKIPRIFLVGEFQRERLMGGRIARDPGPADASGPGEEVKRERL